MKKFLLILSFFAISFIANEKATAQPTPSTISFVSTSGTSHSTLTNVDTAIGNVTLIGNQEYVTFEAAVYKTSGTAAGTVYMQGSLDGVNYDKTDSLVLTNQAVNFKHFKIGSSNYYYYRLYYVSTGTQVSTIYGYYIARRQFKP